MPPSTEDLLDRAKEAENLQGILRQGIGATLIALAASIVSGIISIADVFILPLQALGNSLQGLVGAIFAGPARIIGAGTTSTVQSLLGPFNVGPFTFALAIGSVLLGLYVVNRYVSSDNTGNVIPGLPFDIPTPGVEGPEEEEGN